MTVVAAIVHDGCAYMAADTRISNGSSYTDNAGRKLFKCGSALVGVAGYLTYYRAFGDVLRADKEGPALSPADTEQWCGSLLDRVHKWAQDHDHGEKSDGLYALPLQALVATPRGLWSLSGDGSVLHVARAWHAVGSGGAEAMGSLHTSRAGDEPLERLQRAIEAACAIDSNCGGEIRMASTSRTPSPDPTR